MADEEVCKGEMVKGRGAFLLRERGSYRVKEEDWRELKEGQKLVICDRKTETRDGIKMRERVGLAVIKGELLGAVRVEFKEGQKEGVKVKASLKMGSLGLFEMEARRNDGSKWSGRKTFEKGYKAEEFINKHAKDGYITVVVSIEISKEQDSIKPAEEKLKESLARDVGQLLGDERTSDYVVECQGKQFACHRAVLAARSSTFADGLSSDLLEGVQQKWMVRDAESDVVEAMLAFIYTGDIPEVIKKTPAELLDLANMYNLQELVEACRRAVVAALTPENAVISLIELDRSGANICHYLKSIIWEG
jgi:hypothetical protein